MSTVSCYFRDVLHIRSFPNIFQVDYAKKVLGKLGSVSRVALSYLSPKQFMRPDTFFETFSEVCCKMQTNLAFRLWKFSTLFKERIPSQLGVDYVNVLSILIKQSSKANQELLPSEHQLIDKIFSQISGDKNYLYKLDFFIAATHNDELKKQHKALKELFNIFAIDTFHNFKTKLQNLTEINVINEMNSLDKEQKLTLLDVNILINLPLLKPLLENLKNNEIKGAEDMYLKLIQLENLTLTPFFAELKRLCIESRPPGTIFLGNRLTIQVLNGSDFDCTTAMQQLFMGRICHIGIFVNPEGKGLHLSHVNRITKTHAVMPVKNPLTLPFSYSLTIDIKPLIPISLPERKQQELIEVFSKEFQALAQEEHSELPLAATKQYLKMLILGHKSVYSQTLEKVTYPSKGTSTMCSTYVAIIFLKAVQKMNKVLEEQGFQERIPHPFGLHENLMNMDILRLIYLLKKLNLIKSSPINETIAKVFQSTSSL